MKTGREVEGQRLTNALTGDKAEHTGHKGLFPILVHERNIGICPHRNISLLFLERAIRRVPTDSLGQLKQ